jgi:uncharacterized protein with PQ loop repeat
VFQVGLWDQVGNGADWAYLYFCFVQRRDIMEEKRFRSTELCSFWICSLGWMFWLRFSAWASENAEHCPVLLCCVEAARREAVQFGKDFSKIE